MTDRTDNLPPDVVLVALHRPDGYEDVHPGLLIEDAGINPAFRPEDATDTVRRLLAEAVAAEREAPAGRTAMADDLTDRLRALAAQWDERSYELSAALNDAATRVAALEAENAALRAALQAERAALEAAINATRTPEADR